MFRQAVWVFRRHGGVGAKAILLHAGGAEGSGANVEFVMMGAGQDVFGPTTRQLSDAALAAMNGSVRPAWFQDGIFAHPSRSCEPHQEPTWTADFASHPPLCFMDNRWPG